jgi:hypothetical protein
MRRAAMAGTAAFIMAAGAWAPAVAAPVGFSVHIVAHTQFEGASAFESNIPGCTTGTVENGENAAAHFTPWGGVFIGDKVFTCTGEDAGFVISLRARFGEGGSTGSWTVASGSGDLDGLKGSGSLVGIPTAVGIDDVYTGTLR